MSRRMFTKEFKVLAAQRMLRGESGSELARELEVKRTKLYEWAAELRDQGQARNQINLYKSTCCSDLNVYRI